MDNALGKSSWEIFCEMAAEYAAYNDDFIMLAQSDDYGMFDSKRSLSNNFFVASNSYENLITNAAGFALGGRKTWIFGRSAMLISRGYGIIRDAIGVPSLPVKIAVFDGGFSCGQNGAAFQIVEDIALMRGMPRMNVFIPSDETSVRSVISTAFELAEPSYIRLGQSPLVSLSEEKGKDFPDSAVRIVREGSGVTICACGIMVARAVKAAEILEQQGIDAEIIDCGVLSPFPEQILLSSVRRTGCCVTAEEHSVIGGLGSAVCECLSRTYPVPVRFVAVEDSFAAGGLPEELREYAGLTWKEIVNASAQAWALRKR